MMKFLQQLSGHHHNKLHSVGLILTIFSFLLLYPGVTQPILSLKMNIHVQAKIVDLQGNLIDKSQSILGTVRSLFQKNRPLVAFLILLFSILVPLMKGGLILTSFLPIAAQRRKQLIIFTDLIGKWSMADVFVMAILITFLATKNDAEAMRQKLSMFGLDIPLEVKTRIVSQLEPGFYFFLAYCLVSIASYQIMKFSIGNQNPSQLKLPPADEW